MSNIEITRPDPETGGTRLIVDGVNLSQSVSHIKVACDGPNPPRVTIVVPVTENFRFASTDAVLVLDDSVADVLRRHGWRGPDDADDDGYAGPPIRFPKIEAP